MIIKAGIVLVAGIMSALPSHALSRGMLMSNEGCMRIAPGEEAMLNEGETACEPEQAPHYHSAGVPRISAQAQHTCVTSQRSETGQRSMFAVIEKSDGVHVIMASTAVDDFNSERYRQTGDLAVTEVSANTYRDPSGTFQFTVDPGGQSGAFTIFPGRAGQESSVGGLGCSSNTEVTYEPAL